MEAIMTIQSEFTFQLNPGCYEVLSYKKPPHIQLPNPTPPNKYASTWRPINPDECRLMRRELDEKFDRKIRKVDAAIRTRHDGLTELLEAGLLVFAYYESHNSKRGR